MTFGSVNYIYLGGRLIAKDGSFNSSKKQHYRPFGDSIEGEVDGIGFTGHKFDTALDLSYMQARYYNPVIGRFYGNDPVGYRDVHSFNRFAYANNNPYKYTDPDGMASFPVDKNSKGKVVVTSKYGPRNTGIAGASTNHNGTDFRAGKGTNIKATQDGKITTIVKRDKGGNSILITNDDGSMSGHAHTAATDGLKEGDKVTEGSIIGESDASGTKNAHQHYTYREGTITFPATSSSATSDPMTTQFKDKPASDVCTKSSSNGCW